MAAAACGGDKDDGGSKTSSVDVSKLCEQACTRSQRAACDGDPKDCEAECESQVEDSPRACATELAAMLRCAASATYTCDADDESTPKGCDDELSAWIACAEDGAGGSNNLDGGTGPGRGDASTKPVGSGRADAGSAPDAGVLGTTDGGRDAADGGSRPGTDLPAEPLECRAADDDDACTVCATTNCCEEYTACDGDCQDLVACGAECPPEEEDGGACLDACVEKYPAGAVPAQAVAACVVDRCDAACLGDEISPSVLPKLRSVR